MFARPRLAFSAASTKTYLSLRKIFPLAESGMEVAEMVCWDAAKI